MTALSDPRSRTWYHTIELAPGVVTDGIYDHRPVLGRFGFPDSLAGQHVLDVGTADGFFAFEFERRGAERVAAVDVERWSDIDYPPVHTPTDDEMYVRDNFRLAHGLLESRVEFFPESVYRLRRETVGTFDLVFCGSLLLHLRDPVRALASMRSVTRERFIVETAHLPLLEREHPDMPLVRFGARAHEEATGKPLGDAATYWTMTGAALNDMLAYAGFREIRLLEPFELPPSGHPVIVAHARP